MGVVYLFSLTDSDVPSVVHCPLLTTVYFQHTFDLHTYNLLAITSKKTVDALENLALSWKHIPVIAVSVKTAEYVQQKGGIVEKVSKGNGMAMVDDIKKHYADRKIAYLCAKEKACDISLHLSKENIICEAIELYETHCQAVNYTFNEEDILIFTSPSNVECFLKNHRFYIGQKVVAIGETTKAVLPENVVVFTAKEPSIEATINLAKMLLT